MHAAVALASTNATSIPSTSDRVGKPHPGADGSATPNSISLSKMEKAPPCTQKMSEISAYLSACVPGQWESVEAEFALSFPEPLPLLSNRGFSSVDETIASARADTAFYIVFDESGYPRMPVATRVHYLTMDNRARGVIRALSLLRASGCSPNLCTLPWLANQYRQVIWRLLQRVQRGKTVQRIANEVGHRFYTQPFQGYCTWDRLVQHLKWRYNQEFIQRRTPVVKQIYEGDSDPNRYLILTILSVARNHNTSSSLNDGDPPHIELSDGWYSIGGLLLDDRMKMLLGQGKLRPGMKLKVWGSDLILRKSQNGTNGGALPSESDTSSLPTGFGLAGVCDPIESEFSARWAIELKEEFISITQKRRKGANETAISVPQLGESLILTLSKMFESIEPPAPPRFLSLRSNAARPAPWYAKLGAQPVPHFLVALDSLSPGGGPAPAVKVIVSRRHACRYLLTNSDGSRSNVSSMEALAASDGVMQNRENALEDILQRLEDAYHTRNREIERSFVERRKALAASKSDGKARAALDQECADELTDALDEYNFDVEKVKRQFSSLAQNKGNEVADESLGTAASTAKFRMVPIFTLELLDMHPLHSVHKGAGDHAFRLACPVSALMTIWRVPEETQQEWKEGEMHIVTSMGVGDMGAYQHELSSLLPSAISLGGWVDAGRHMFGQRRAKVRLSSMKSTTWIPSKLKASPETIVAALHSMLARSVAEFGLSPNNTTAASASIMNLQLIASGYLPRYRTLSTFVNAVETAHMQLVFRAQLALQHVRMPSNSAVPPLTLPRVVATGQDIDVFGVVVGIDTGSPPVNPGRLCTSPAGAHNQAMIDWAIFIADESGRSIRISIRSSEFFQACLVGSVSNFPPNNMKTSTNSAPCTLGATVGIFNVFLRDFNPAEDEMPLCFWTERSHVATRFSASENGGIGRHFLAARNALSAWLQNGWTSPDLPEEQLIDIPIPLLFYRITWMSPLVKRVSSNVIGESLNIRPSTSPKGWVVLKDMMERMSQIQRSTGHSGKMLSNRVDVVYLQEEDLREVSDVTNSLVDLSPSMMEFNISESSAAVNLEYIASSSVGAVHEFPASIPHAVTALSDESLSNGTIAERLHAPADIYQQEAIYPDDDVIDSNVASELMDINKHFLAASNRRRRPETRSIHHPPASVWISGKIPMLPTDGTTTLHPEPWRDLVADANLPSSASISSAPAPTASVMSGPLPVKYQPIPSRYTIVTDEASGQIRVRTSANVCGHDLISRLGTDLLPLPATSAVRSRRHAPWFPVEITIPFQIEKSDGVRKYPPQVSLVQFSPTAVFQLLASILHSTADTERESTANSDRALLGSKRRYPNQRDMNVANKRRKLSTECEEALTAEGASLKTCDMVICACLESLGLGMFVGSSCEQGITSCVSPLQAARSVSMYGLLAGTGHSFPSGCSTALRVLGLILHRSVVVSTDDISNSQLGQPMLVLEASVPGSSPLYSINSGDGDRERADQYLASVRALTHKSAMTSQCATCARLRDCNGKAKIKDDSTSVVSSTVQEENTKFDLLPFLPEEFTSVCNAIAEILSGVSLSICANLLQEKDQIDDDVHEAVQRPSPKYRALSCQI
jgi:hypothetical protein